MAAALAPALRAAVCSELSERTPLRRPSVPAADLARSFGRAGVAAEAQPDLAAALARARAIASEEGGVVLAAGSHYLLGPARRALGLCED
jgi:hypothetical protein